MKNLSINNSQDELITLFKGVDSLLLKTIPPNKRKDLVNITIKELTVLAESAQPFASKELIKVLSKKSGNLIQSQIFDINA